jgi:hypothetical protein
VSLPLPLVEVWEELQPEVEHPTGLAGLMIIRALIEDEVKRRVGLRHHPDAAPSCLRWGQQPGYVVFAGQKVAIGRPRVLTRQGEEVPLDNYARRQHDGRRQRTVREGIVAGLSARELSPSRAFPLQNKWLAMYVVECIYFSIRMDTCV